MRPGISFNPRTRRGCDAIRVANDLTGPVSIHAPAGGATRIIQGDALDSLFQSTHPQGVRPMVSPGIKPWTSFNPRTRRGCDMSHVAIHDFILRFNPRTRRGCDPGPEKG